MERSDLHVHTTYSCDSSTTMDEYCKKAIELGLKYICFTDHVDFNKADTGYGFYKSSCYFDELEREKEKYCDRLKILSGIEFAEPHIYRKEFDELKELPYDFILGSIHFWIDDMFPSEMVKRGIPAEAVFERYWPEVLKAVSYGGFDALAHMDFPKRYYKTLLYDKSMVYDIFKKMVKNDIALEINTSSLRKGLTESMPDRSFLDIYEEAGGIKVTIGGDTHCADDLACDYEYGAALISGNLKNTVYIGRKPYFI